MKSIVKMNHSKQEYSVETVKGASIRVITDIPAFHTLPAEHHDLTFKIGDKAEYDSYNLSYVGVIISITDKTVTIDPGYGSKRRLSLAEFAWRNYKFSLEQTILRNAEESQCI